jgi:hypothetical protein
MNMNNNSSLNEAQKIALDEAQKRAAIEHYKWHKRFGVLTSIGVIVTITYYCFTTYNNVFNKKVVQNESNSAVAGKPTNTLPTIDISECNKLKIRIDILRSQNDKNEESEKMKARELPIIESKMKKCEEKN